VLTDQPLGRNITHNLHALASSLNISTPLGAAPHDLYLARYPYGHQRSLLTVWNNAVLPLTVVDKERKGKRIIIGNTGSMRFELVCFTCMRAVPELRVIVCREI
jgi:hypothetical protein